MAWLLVGACLAVPAQADEYRLQAGDVLEFSVAGVPDLRQRIPVDIDGDIAVPLAGSIPAAGQPVSAVRDKIREILPKTALTLRIQGGGEQQTVIAGNEVSLTIADYRPVYVGGDVAKPGEQKFSPGLTVRQAVALSGGYDLQRYRMESPILTTADLRGEYENLWIELAQGEATVARFQAELAGKPRLDGVRIEGLPIAPAIQQRIVKDAQDLLTSRLSDFDREQTYLRNTLKLAEDRLVVIQDQFRKETEAAKLDLDEIERVTDLNKRGVVPLTRAVETRRLSLTTATRALQTGAEVEKVKRDRADAARGVERFNDQRKVDLLKDLQDTNVRVAQTRTRLAAVGEKLLYTGVVRSQLVRGTGGRPQITLHRRSERGQPMVVSAVDEDMVLLPGDTIDVALRLEYEFKPSN
jgi:polysaccharide biosynthesis/export protein